MQDEQRALDWLFGFTDWERGIGWSNRSSLDLNWNLGRTRWLLDAVGSPDRAMPVVLIAGTKGKGSTAAMIESIARSGYYRTILYSQPHLHSYRERVRLNGDPIPPDTFATLVAELQGPVADLMTAEPEAGEPTTYEITTALALLAARRHDADLAVIEVGLGGRLDATNCLDPAVSVLTRVSYDHTQILGPTLGAITREKVAIARPGRPLVSAPQRPASRRELVRAARQIGARYRIASPLESAASRVSTSGTQKVRGVFLGETFEAELALLGGHQRENAGVATAVVEELVRGRILQLDQRSIQRGLGSVRWPGRLELLPGTPRIVLDGAHNGESAERLVAALRESFVFDRLILVLGILRDKDARSMLRWLVPAADIVIATRSSSPRAIEAEQLHRLASLYGGDVRVETDVSSALQQARTLAGYGDLVCITGSLTMVGEARDLLIEGGSLA